MNVVKVFLVEKNKLGEFILKSRKVNINLLDSSRSSRANRQILSNVNMYKPDFQGFIYI